MNDNELLEALIECESWITANLTAMAKETAKHIRTNPDWLVEIWLQENKTLQHAREVIKNHEG
jgi:hypothetical protein